MIRCVLLYRMLIMIRHRLPYRSIVLTDGWGILMKKLLLFPVIRIKLLSLGTTSLNL